MKTDPIEARILVVDDDPGNLRALERILRRRGGWEVRSASDSRSVGAHFTAFEPDLLITDLRMPHVDGFAVMGQVRALTPVGEYFPIVVISADLSPEARRRALSEGATDFVSKPFDDDEITLRIHNLLETRFLHRALQEQNRMLDARVRERTFHLEQAQVEVLERLVRAAELRDDDTGEHTRRVGERAAALALCLGLSSDEVEVIRRAAPLHDIGKIGTPDSVLLKPGRLTEEEQALMRTHTVVGARVLSGSPSRLLRCAEEIALYHHERWDGTGYAGLSGEAIPLSARIVAVADVFDALTHERPYKRAWPREEGIDEIRRQAGRHFDPRVVEAFLAAEASSPAIPARRPTGPLNRSAVPCPVPA